MASAARSSNKRSWKDVLAEGNSPLPKAREITTAPRKHWGRQAQPCLLQLPRLFPNCTCEGQSTQRNRAPVERASDGPWSQGRAGVQAPQGRSWCPGSWAALAPRGSWWQGRHLCQATSGLLTWEIRMGGKRWGEGEHGEVGDPGRQVGNGRSEA